MGNSTYKEHLFVEHTGSSHLAGAAQKSENLRRDSYWLQRYLSRMGMMLDHQNAQKSTKMGKLLWVKKTQT